MQLTFRHDENGVTIDIAPERRGLLARMFRRGMATADFDALPDDARGLVAALAELRKFEDEAPGSVRFEADHLHLGHDAAASLSAGSAAALSLPPDIHLTLVTDVAGTLGHPDFRLSYEWRSAGQRQRPRREGCLLFTAQGLRRIPLWMKRALDLADGFSADAPLDAHWAALATFRQMLAPDERVPIARPEDGGRASLAMSNFLRRLEVSLADRFSISPDRTLSHFDVIPYSGARLARDCVPDDGISESLGELEGEPLAEFQYKLGARGACPAYHLGANRYVVIDRSAAPVLHELVRARSAGLAERQAFIRNPRAFISEAVAEHLAAAEEGFTDLDGAGQEEAVEAVASPAFIESREYSERVVGVTVWSPPAQEFTSSGTTWLPEIFPEAVARALREMPDPELVSLRETMAARLPEESASVTIGGESVPVTEGRVAAVDAILAARRAAGTPPAGTDKPPGSGPIVLDTRENIEELTWAATLRPRTACIPASLPASVTTPLKPHQVGSFNWAVSAWQAGLPGILNADEQGLGKTLQTIAFLAWLQDSMRSPQATMRAPVLVVAPTSLLVNWEEEVARHVEDGGLGHLNRLYGSHLRSMKGPGNRGKDTESGLPQLDFRWLEEAFEEGRAHRQWFLTTYTTLTNYQHSLGRIPFSVMVCDEIQAIKNFSTIRSKAVEAMNADFRIGLTGTPIENSSLDLWTIMDRLVPGALGSAREFRERYGVPDEGNMAELHGLVFQGTAEQPPLALRRLKAEVARDLPDKTRRIHPRLMPSVQACAYEAARTRLAEGGAGAALKMLHHIRSVSVHPGSADGLPHEDFVSGSARLAGTLGILDTVHAAQERALVFVEHRELQYHLAEILRQRYHLRRVEIINGATPIARRQAIVNAFQRHLDGPDAFDVLILGPRAAGTGLTLTAATHVIHLSRWWNPAVEEQCNDRIHRIGQSRPVTIHVPMAVHAGYREGSFDCLLHSLMERKRRLASQVLWPMGDTRDDVEQLRTLLGAVEGAEAGGHDPLAAAIAAMFRRDGRETPECQPDGSYLI